MKIITILFVLAIFTTSCFAQKTDSVYVSQIDTVQVLKSGTNSSSKTDSVKKFFYLKGMVTITNKGISYIPNLSLGKPAMIFDLSMANERLFFEPQLRFSLTGEPWAFLFPLRYKIKHKGKFQLSAGVNPLLNFKSVTYTVDGVSTSDLVNRRYLGGELKPNFFITKNVSIGIVYLYFFGVSERTVRNTNFVSFNTNFAKIKLGRKFIGKFNPQLYYLDQDGKNGYYFNSVLTLLKRDFPFSLQTNLNTTIKTTIPKSEKFIWNVSLIYSVNKTYTPDSSK